MKFGCCLNMVSTQPDGTGIEFIDQLKNAGFDYVELPTAQMMQSTGVEGRLTASAAAMPQVIWALPSMGSPPFRAYFTLNALVQG